MKARIENGIIKLYGQLPKDFENILNFRIAGDEVHRQHGFYDVVEPVYNPETQERGVIFFDDVSQIFTYPVTDKTPEQIEAEQIEKIDSQARTTEFSIDNKLLKKLLASQIEALPEADALEYRTLYKPYRVGIALVADERFYYPANDKLYKVIQPHTTQLDWKPDVVGSLYVEVSPPGITPQWKQPLGAHDAYKIGDKVIHNTFA